MTRVNLEDIITWIRNTYGETVFDHQFVRELDYWRGVLASMEALYEEAGKIRLAQEKLSMRLDYIHQEITKGAAAHLARVGETLAGDE